MNKLLILFSILSLVLSGSDGRLTKADLYKRYPQAKGNSCSQKTNQYLTNIYDREYFAMWQTSVKMLTDLGDMVTCQNITDDAGNKIAHYASF